MELLSQIMIFIFGAGGIWLVARKEDWKKWGYVVGMLAQPFWAYTAIVNQQWGILALTLFYTYSWGMGIYNYCIKTEDDNINRFINFKFKKQKVCKFRHHDKYVEHFGRCTACGGKKYKIIGNTVIASNFMFSDKFKKQLLRIKTMFK